MDFTEQIIVIATNLDQPRIVKRIHEISYKYNKVLVLGFKRNIYSVDNYKKLESIDNVDIVVMQKIVNENYIGRVRSYWNVFKRIKKEQSKRKEVGNVYVFGLDFALISFLSGAKLKCFEIADIVWLYKKSLARRVFRLLEKFLVIKSEKVVFTSQAYYEQYYSYLLSKKIEIIENKLQHYGSLSPIETLCNDKIVIGYIGSFRYEKILLDLIKVVENNTNLNLRLYGDTSNTHLKNYLIETSTKSRQVEYYGPFKNPEDLEEIYKSINVNFVAYDNKLANERVAMPNKYYESGFFNVPILCSTDTYVGQRVLEEGMGWVVDPEYVELNRFFENLTIDKILKVSESIKAIDKAKFSY